MSELGIGENFLLKQNGCRIIQVSSEREGSPASNILLNNERFIWIVQKRLPQHCIIETNAIRTYPKVFNRVGFYCWHEYESNPALIEVAYTSSSSQEWRIVGKLRLQQKSGRQYFKLKEIPSTEMKLLRITLLQNFGDRCTYLNQVELGFQEDPIDHQPQPLREKTFSDFIKLTSSEKQLKKAQEQIKRLSIENQEIKQTLLRQGETIIQMQSALRMVTKELQKLQRMQEVQSKQLLSNKKSKEIDKIIEKKMSHKLKLGNNSSSSSSSLKHQEKHTDGKKYIEDKFINKKTIPNQNQTYNKNNNRTSSRKSREALREDWQRPKEGAVRQSKNTLLNKSKSLSDSSLNMGSELDNNRSKYSEKCSEMMSKLQFLLAEREKREKQLKKRNHSPIND